MIIESYEYVIYTALFLLPGFLMNKIISIILPPKNVVEADKVLSYLGYSLLNFTIWLWLFWMIRRIIDSERTLYWLLLSFAVVITSVVSGTALGVIRKKELIRKFFQKVGLQTEHPIPTAWDYKFSKIENGRWVIVRLKSGKVLRGLYSNHSFASSDESFRDIYIEMAYIADKEYGDLWKPVDRTDGIWINPDEIGFIEFKE